MVKHDSPAKLGIGDSVMAVIWIDGSPVAAPSIVRDVAPPVLITSEPVYAEVDCPEPVTLLWTFEGRMVRSESQLIFTEQVAAGIALHVDLIDANELDRRRFDRIPVEAPVFVRKVNETVRTEEVHLFFGHSQDVGLGGASIVVDEPTSPGTTLEVTFKPNGFAPIKLYAVVVRADEIGLRVAFLEPGGRTDEHLERWIKAVA